MGRIVVGVDGSNSSRRALKWAAEEAERIGAELQAVMTWHNPYPDMWIIHDPSGTKPIELTGRALERIVKGVLGDHPAIDVEISAIEGPAAKVLVEISKDADMLVVGNRGLSEFVEMLLGSVSLHCVTHAPCPVVVVR